MASNSFIPESGIELSCMEFTEPVEITVVTILQNPDAAAPNLISFPSIAPRVLSMPILEIAGLPFISMMILGMASIKKPTVITPKSSRQIFPSDKITESKNQSKRNNKLSNHLCDIGQV